MAFTTTSLEEALATLGELLTERGQSVELVAIGGGSLLLMQLIERPTKDLDVVAIVRSGQYVSAVPFPEVLSSAVKDVAAATGLGDDWLNPGPASLLDLGLPRGFESRLTTRNFGGLTVHLASRVDQICFKLYASVDQGPRSKHVVDLERLSPSAEELASAAEWCRTHDVSDGFAHQLGLAIRDLGARRREP